MNSRAHEIHQITLNRIDQQEIATPNDDFLLIYTIENNLMNFIRAETHSELFE